MKALPAGSLVAALVIGILPFSAKAGEESAEQLAEQSGLGGNAPDDEESARQLAIQRGMGGKPQDNEQSASQLAEETGLEGKPVGKEQSAQQLADQLGVGGNARDNEESAGQLAQERLGMDPTPTPTPKGASVYGEGGGVNGTIYASAGTPDGKTIIAGQFNEVNYVPRSNLARINADGTLDQTFLPKVTDGVNGPIYAVEIDAQGGILIGGLFSLADETPVYNFARYESDGTLDKDFSKGGGPNGQVLSISVLSDGSIVIGGEFSQVGTTPRKNIARFASNGTLATAAPSSESVTGQVRTLSPTADGSVVAGGSFQSDDGSGRNVLKSDGSE